MSVSTVDWSGFKEAFGRVNDVRAAVNVQALKRELAEAGRLPTRGERQRARKKLRNAIARQEARIEQEVGASTQAYLDARGTYDAIRKSILEDEARDKRARAKMTAQKGLKAGRNQQRDDALLAQMLGSPGTVAPTDLDRGKALVTAFNLAWAKAETAFDAAIGEGAVAARLDDVAVLISAPRPTKDAAGLNVLLARVEELKQLVAMKLDDRGYEELFARYDKDWFKITAAYKADEINETEMKGIWNYRQRETEALLNKLQGDYPGVQFEAVGSTTLTSDIDVGVLSHGTDPNNNGEVFFDHQIVEVFNSRFQTKFGNVPGVYFDVNLYAVAPRVSPLDEISDGNLRKNMKAMESSGQDVGALMKVRRYLSWDEYWGQMNAVIGKLDPTDDAELIQTTRRQYEEADSLFFLSLRRTLDAYAESVLYEPKQQGQPDRLVDTSTLPKAEREFREDVAVVRASIDATPLANSEAMQTAQRSLLDIIERLEKRPAVMMEVTNALFTETVAEVRRMETETLELEEMLTELKAEGTPDQRAISQVQAEIAGLAARIPTFYADATFFANEAYHTNGPYDHIVVATQGVEKALENGRIDDVSKAEWAAMSEEQQAAKIDEVRAARRDALPVDACMASFNEQLGDLLKDLKHHGEEPAGRCFAQSSKYMQRMMDALALVQDKLPDVDWTAVNRPLAVAPAAMAARISEGILPVRKGKTPSTFTPPNPNPKPQEALETHVCENMQDWFGVTTVDAAKARFLEIGALANAEARKYMELAAADEAAYFQAFGAGSQDVV